MHISTSHAVESQASDATQARVAQTTPPTRAAEREANPDAEDARPAKSVNPTGDAARLSEADLRQVQQLKARDREVRAHEQAHLAAGGSLTRGGARYTYEKGPDGKRYAVGGEVQIDSARVPGDPKATAERAAQVQRAATAPASPSAQDRAVAAEAAALATRARAEARAEATAEARSETTAKTREETSATAESGVGTSTGPGAGPTGATPASLPGGEPSQLPGGEAEADKVGASASSNLSLYESVAAIENGQASSPSLFEPVLA